MFDSYQWSSLCMCSVICKFRLGVMGMGNTCYRGCIVEQLLDEKRYSIVVSLDDRLVFVDIEMPCLYAISRADI